MNDNPSKSRMALFLILHALLWVFAIFLADSLWGDAVSQLLVWPFIIVNTVLAILFSLKLRGQRDKPVD